MPARKMLLDTYDFCHNYAPEARGDIAGMYRDLVSKFRWARIVENMRRENGGNSSVVAYVTFENPITGEQVSMPLMNMFPRQGEITLARVRERVRRWAETYTEDAGNFLITGFGVRAESEREREIRIRNLAETIRS